MKILIISTNALGDTYLSAAAIAPLRAHFSGGCEITMLTSDSCRELSEHLDVDRAIVLRSKSLGEALRVLHALRRVKYDYVFSFFPGRLNSLFLIATRAVLRAGYFNIRYIEEWWRSKPQRILFTGRRIPETSWSSDKSYIERVTVCLAALKINSMNARKPRLVHVETRNVVPPGFVLIHARSSGTSRSLGIDAVQGIVDVVLNRTSLNIYCLGWNNDLLLLKQAIPAQTRIGFLEQLALPELVNYMLQSAFYIGVDSFPLHVADAYEIKYIGIFGPTRPEAFQSCRCSIEFRCDDLSTVNAKSMVERIEPALLSMFP